MGLCHNFVARIGGRGEGKSSCGPGFAITHLYIFSLGNRRCRSFVVAGDSDVSCVHSERTRVAGGAVFNAVSASPEMISRAENGGGSMRPGLEPVRLGEHMIAGHQRHGGA